MTATLLLSLVICAAAGVAGFAILASRRTDDPVRSRNLRIRSAVAAIVIGIAGIVSAWASGFTSYGIVLTVILVVVAILNAWMLVSDLSHDVLPWQRDIFAGPLPATSDDELHQRTEDAIRDLDDDQRPLALAVLGTGWRIVHRYRRLDLRRGRIVTTVGLEHPDEGSDRLAFTTHGHSFVSGEYWRPHTLYAIITSQDAVLRVARTRPATEADYRDLTGIAGIDIGLVR